MFWRNEPMGNLLGARMGIRRAYGEMVAGRTGCWQDWRPTLPAGLAYQDDRYWQIADFHAEGPVFLAFFGDGGEGCTGGRFDREDGGVRGAGCLQAHLDQSCESGSCGRIGIVRNRSQEGEIALRSHALVGAIHRKVAVAHGVDTGLDHLAAAVRAWAGKAENADQGALRNGQRDGVVTGFRTGGDGFAEPDFAPWSCRASHAVSLGLNYRGVGRRQTGDRGSDRFQLIDLGKSKCRRQEKEGQALDHGSFENLMIGAGDRIRTGDIDLGKVALYQLSYSRPYGKPYSPTETIPMSNVARMSQKRRHL